MKVLGNHGPPQVWQHVVFQWTGDISPLQRLYRAGHRGLPVGRGSRYLGGLAVNVAKRLERDGLVYLVWDPKLDTTRVYACQLSFNFQRGG